MLIVHFRLTARFRRKNIEKDTRILRVKNQNRIKVYYKNTNNSDLMPIDAISLSAKRE